MYFLSGFHQLINELFALVWRIPCSLKQLNGGKQCAVTYVYSLFAYANLYVIVTTPSFGTASGLLVQSCPLQATKDPVVI